MFKMEMSAADCKNTCADAPPSLQNLSLETQSTANVSASSQRGRESSNGSFLLSVDSCEIYRQFEHPLPRNMRLLLAFFTCAGIHNVSELSEIAQRTVEITNEETMESMERVHAQWNPKQIKLPSENVDVILGMANEAKSDTGATIPILPIAWAPLDLDEYKTSNINMTIDLDVLEDLNDFPLLRVANPAHSTSSESPGASPALPRDLEDFDYYDNEDGDENSLSLRHHQLAEKILSSIAVRKATIQLDLRSKTNSRNSADPQEAKNLETKKDDVNVAENEPALFSSFKRGTVPKVASRVRGTTNPSTLWMTRSRTNQQRPASNARRQSNKQISLPEPVESSEIPSKSEEGSSKKQGDLLHALQKPIAMVLKGQQSAESHYLDFRTRIADFPLTLGKSAEKSMDGSIGGSFDFTTIIVKKPLSKVVSQKDKHRDRPSKNNERCRPSTNVSYHAEVESEALEKLSFYTSHHADDDGTVCTTVDNGKGLVVFSAPRRRRLTRAQTLFQSASHLMFPEWGGSPEEDLSTLDG